MVWFLVLHIGALLIWMGALLYLPLLIAVSAPSAADGENSATGYTTVARFLFTQVASPAALLAIVAGTIVFMLNRIIDPWLVIKLTLVTALVVCHALTGLMVLRSEEAVQGSQRSKSVVLVVVMCMLMASIVGLVLAKPSEEFLLWWR